MKTILYFVVAILLFTGFSGNLLGADTFYVNPYTAGSSDANDGSEENPWLTLNADKWTDGCTIKISGTIYITQEVILTGKSVTVEGVDADAILAALDDDEYEMEEQVDYRFFTVGDKDAGASLTLKDITLKNLIRDVEVDPDGGMIYVNYNSSLNLENVRIEKARLVDGNGFGGAIHSQGNLTAVNSTFENCQAVLGGAVFIKNTEAPITARFEKCTFSNNIVGQGGTGSQGGAVDVNSAKNVDLSFDNCYFLSNESTLVSGGALGFGIVDDCDVKLHITNSTFAHNSTEQTGGAIYLGGYSTKGNLEYAFINNVFFANECWGDHGIAIRFDTNYMPAEVLGRIMIINNTFSDNKHPSGKGGSSFNGVGHAGMDMIMINNLCMDPTMFGIVVEEYDGSFSSNIILNNLFNSYGGSGGSGPTPIGFVREVQDPDKNNFCMWEYHDAGIVEEDDMETKLIIIGLENSLLSPPEGYLAPALPISKPGMAWERGISSYNYLNENIIPQTDIFGQPISGTKDVGAFEFQDEGSDNDKFISSETGLTIYVDPRIQMLMLSEKVAALKIYNVNGVTSISVTDVVQVDLSGLTPGVYIVQAVDGKGNVISKKIIR